MLCMYVCMYVCICLTIFSTHTYIHIYIYIKKCKKCIIRLLFGPHVCKFEESLNLKQGMVLIPPVRLGSAIGFTPGWLIIGWTAVPYVSTCSMSWKVKYLWVNRRLVGHHKPRCRRAIKPIWDLSFWVCLVCFIFTFWDEHGPSCTGGFAMFSSQGHSNQGGLASTSWATANSATRQRWCWCFW